MAALETTATFDKSTDSFVIHSPTETSTKWWAGDNFAYASHALLMARLIIDGDDFGMNCFLVPIRDEKTYE